MSKPIIQYDAPEQSDPASLVERTMLEIRNHIRRNSLKPGDLIPSENTLAAETGVSRTVAREALRGLAALGILEIGNGRRARVAGPDAGALSAILEHAVHAGDISVVQIQDARRTIELRCVALAALHRSDDDARALLETVSGMFEAVAAEESERVRELDILFHEIIARAAGNPLYSIFVNSFRVITRRTWDIGWRARGDYDNRVENIRLHERIAHAVMAQEPTRAEAAMSEHFDSSYIVLLRAGVK